MAISLPIIENKTILTATGGFLGSGYTHTINLYHGCPFAHALCGAYCYAQHNFFVTKGRPWHLYGVKRNVAHAYRLDFDALKRPRRGMPKPLRIYFSSSTDPYPPQESHLRLAQALLTEMLDRPPDTLVIQTRSPLVGRDRELIERLSKLCELWVSLTVETDMERVPGFPNHATPIRKRINTVKEFHSRGVPTQVTVSPLMPLADAERFAWNLGEVCDRVILDHYLLGDGSSGGLRTMRTDFPELLEACGFGEWNRLEKFWDVKATFERVLGPRRVLVSAEGFNSVGPNRKSK